MGTNLSVQMGARYSTPAPPSSSTGHVSWVENQTKGLPKCLNCGHPVSVKGDPRHGSDDVPNHHFWTEDVQCHPDDLQRWRGQSQSKPPLTVRLRH